MKPFQISLRMIQSSQVGMKLLQNQSSKRKIEKGVSAFNLEDYCMGGN